MYHRAELAIHQYLEDAANGNSTMSDETIDTVAREVAEALKRQFGSGNKRGEFRLRMSNVGRPACQRWFDKNKPETALPKPTTFVMNMMIGDIVESVFKAILKESNVAFEDTDKVSLPVGDSNDTNVSGSYDLIIDGAVDDVKSASDWSYRNKFESFDILKSDDSFGYVGQLAGYAKASDKKAGGWWVVNKANGGIKYVPADNLDMEAELENIKQTVEKVNANEFKRCFKPEPEFYKRKPTGNMLRPKGCKFCDYRYECWPTLTEGPSRVSIAKEKPMVEYIN